MGKHEAPKPQCGECRGSGQVKQGTNGKSVMVTCPLCWGKGTA